MASGIDVVLEHVQEVARADQFADAELSRKGNDNAKIVYIAPTKALCKEKAEQWRRKFGMMTMPVSELTGDTSRAEMRNVREAKIIVTTPEKWDSVTRSWADHRKLLDLVELFLIDEVHILKESRGATLEAVVSRMKTYGTKVRFIALSATVPNSGDIATWLGKNCTNPHTPAHQEVFGEEFRPVKLVKAVHGFDSRLGDHPFDSYLNGQLWKHIELHSQKKPMMVFCMTRKSCRNAAQQLAKEWSQRQPGARLWPEPSRRIPVVDAELQELVRYGVAFHHAGLDSDDRRAIQQAFEEGNISVICCTSTLAVGINLPCHTVVLKGTVGYQDGGQLCEYSDLEVMQMLGRAGRPQFEKSAVAIILTRSRNRKRYEELDSGQQILESTLHKNLIEHLNSEISLGTFKNREGAKKWLDGTFLSVRLHRNPGYYNELTQNGSYPKIPTQSIDQKLEIICDSAIENLLGIRLIKGCPDFQPTEYGRAMSKYMIRFDTMERILKIPKGSKIQEILVVLCEASEFNEFRWQPSEKEIFREINKDPFIMYPIENNLTTVAHKVSLLIQMELGRVEQINVTGFERQRLRMEAGRVLEVMHRLTRAVIECKGSDMDGQACWAALELARSIKARAWEGKTMQLLQVPQLGPVLMRKLVSNNIRTVTDLAATDAGTIERLASRNPPFGKKMAESLACFPRLTLRVKVKNANVDADGKAVVHVDAELGLSSKRGKWQGKIPIVTFMAATMKGVSTYFWRDSLKTFDQAILNTHQVHFTWVPAAAGERIICRFACEEIVGTVVSAEIGHEFPASVFSLHPNGPSAQSLQCGNVIPTRALSVPLAFDNDIDDEEMLQLVDWAGQGRSFARGREMSYDTGDDELYPMINRAGSIDARAPKPSELTPLLLSRPEADDMNRHDPVRLSNGRYKCGHPCSQAVGGKTVRGHDCGHDCCRNGSKHPPKSHNSRGKRKKQNDDTVVAESASMRETSKSNACIKRVKQSQQSGFGANISPTGAVGNLIPLKNSQSRKEIDLSNYNIDDEGMIDLTKEDSPVENDMPLNVFETGQLSSFPSADGAKPLTQAAANADSMLDDLSDSDLMYVEIDQRTRHRGDTSSLQGRRSSYIDRADDTTTGSMPKQVQVDHECTFLDQNLSYFDRSSAAEKRHGFYVAEGGIQGTYSQTVNDTLRSGLPIDSALGDETVFDEADHDRGEGSSDTQQNQAGEPEWVNEFDADFIDEFRGLVDFV